MIVYRRNGDCQSATVEVAAPGRFSIHVCVRKIKAAESCAGVRIIEIARVSDMRDGDQSRTIDYQQLAYISEVNHGKATRVAHDPIDIRRFDVPFRSVSGKTGARPRLLPVGARANVSCFAWDARNCGPDKKHASDDRARCPGFHLSQSWS